MSEFFSSVPVTAVPEGIMFWGCLSVRPIHMNTMSEEHCEGISSALAQISTWIQGRTD